MKLIAATLVSTLLLGVAQAATVTLSSGFGGINVTIDGAASPGHVFTVGTYDMGTMTFTAFNTTPLRGTGGTNISGAFGGTSPVSLNNAPVYVYVGAGDTVDFGVAHAIFSTGSNFPSDVSDGLASETVTFESIGASGVDLVGGLNSAADGANTVNLTVVPEPSVAILGTLGCLGLIRRRR